MGEKGKKDKGKTKIDTNWSDREAIQRSPEILENRK